MKYENIDQLIKISDRLLFITGYAAVVIGELAKYATEEEKKAIDWIIEAVNNAVYLDKPLPDIPKYLPPLPPID